VHTGDFTSVAVLEELEGLAPVRAVYGNADESSLRAKLAARLEFEHEGVRIGLVHSGGPRRDRHDRLRRWFPDTDLIAYGHSHEPEVTRSQDCWIVNPGSPTDRRRAPGHTMVVVERRTPRLVDL